MLKIFLTRHGQNEDNAAGILNGHRDLPLTEFGRQQARQLAEGIKHANLTFDTIYTSPLCRAFETAVIIAEILNLPKPEVMNELIERDFGVMTGKPVRDIEKLCGADIVKTGTITYFLSPEGAETFPILLERGKCAIAKIIARHADGSVLVVTHGDFGKMLYAAYYNLPWMNTLTMFHFGNSELLLLARDSKPEESHFIHIEQKNH